MRKFVFLTPWIVWGVMGFLSVSGLQAQESKILITQTACVDIYKILSTVNQNYAMRNSLLSTEEGYREESLDLEEKIRELEDYLLENEGSLNSRRVEEIHAEIEYQKSELEKLLLADTDNTNEEIILKGIYRLIKNIAEQDGLSLIIEKSAAVVYNKPEVDITDKVIEAIASRIKPESE